VQDRHSRPSFNLTNSYENIRFVFDYRAGDSRVLELVRAKEGGANGRFFDLDDDSRHSLDHQEDHDRQVLEHEEGEQQRFGGSFGFASS